MYWDEVLPIRANVKIADMPRGSQVREEAIHFNKKYKALLQCIHDAFNGKPDALNASYEVMFDVHVAAGRLMGNPLPSGDGNAAPTFEMDLTDV